MNLGILKELGQIATGDPILCTYCQAILNNHSQLAIDQTWNCEFCHHSNNLKIDEEAKPNSPDLTYISKPLESVLAKSGEAQDITIILCLDISGSMCVTKQTDGKFAQKLAKKKNMEDLMQFGDGSEQFCHGEDEGTAYISRMQCIQIAIEKHLNDLCLSTPKRKVGIVTFNNQVDIIGDGSLPSKVITGDKLSDFDELLSSGLKDAENYLSKPVSETKEQIKARVNAIEETGQTALGPGLLVSLGIAMKGVTGSKIILCTDGLANIGLGSVDSLKSESEINAAKGFYSKVGELAKEKGISISLISIVGEDCKLELLSPLAELTGGDILKVDPVNLAQEFASILSEDIIATNVQCKVILPQCLTFREESKEFPSYLIKDIGNATEKQQIAIEYCAKPSETLMKMPEFDLFKVQKLPFQVQIQYINLNGMNCMKVITKEHEITWDKEETKKEANFAVLSVNAVQQMSKFAKDGEFRQAQAVAYMWKNFLKGTEFFDEYMTTSTNLYMELQKQQAKNLKENGQEGKNKMQSDAVVSEAQKAEKMNFQKLFKK